jgi:hypothetical protein
MASVWFSLPAATIALTEITAAVAIFGGYNGFGVWGTIASVLGLMLTLNVAQAVWRIEQRYVARILLDQALERLRTIKKKLGNAAKSNRVGEIRGCLQSWRSIAAELRRHYPAEVPLAQDHIEIDALLMESDDRIAAQAVDLCAKLEGRLDHLTLLKTRLSWSCGHG